jgi:hypothetical protein
MKTNGKEIIVNPTGHPDKKTEQDSTKMAWGEIQCCGDEDNKADGNWESVPAVDVPEWARAHDTMGKMISGHACRNDAQGGGKWYRFVHCKPPGMNTAGVIEGVVRGH